MDGDPFDLVGDVLDGQFRVDAFAGEGDLSVVYRGHHIGVDAPVAIKCLNLPATLDQELVRPLVESFREASRLHYRLARGNMNIAQSIAAGQTIAPRTGTTVPYLVREWLEGHSLTSDLEKRRAEGKKGRGVEEMIALLEPAVDGVAYAHRHDVVHLSFSPSNLFMAMRDGAGSLKVLDFGVAHAMNQLEGDLPDDERPSGGLRVLFPAYAAPEQLDKSVGDLGPWTDVYAIALVVMEVLSDRVVMEGTETGVLVERSLDKVRRPTPQAHGLKLARNLDIVLSRAVSRAPEKRQKDAGTFWSDVKGAARGTPSRTMVPSMRPKTHTLLGMAPGTSTPPPATSVPPPSLAPSLSLAPSPSLAPAPSPSPSPSPSLAPSPSLGPAPVAASVPVPVPEPEPARPAQIITARLPPPPPVPALPFSAVETAPALVRSHATSSPTVAGRLSPTFIAITASVAGVLLVTLIVLIVTWPRSPRASGVAGASSRSSAGATAPSPQPPFPTTPEPAGSAEQGRGATGAPEPPRFSPSAAQRALFATERETLRCKRGTMWGIGRATVTFANDGTVDHVLVGPPFTNTATGQCVGDAMSGVHVPPFGGKQGVYVARFFVEPR